ncbi:MAG: universal stress protein [Acidimicrobiia bacterium]|nr:universal stress protein [Acidimicrobiia bacterium]
MAKALIATDGSDFALAAAKRARELLRPDMEVLLLTVVPPPVLPVAAPVTGIEAAPVVTPETADELAEANLEEARRSLERTARALGGAVERRVEIGDPAAEISRVAEDEGVGVIVVGSHGSGFVKRVLLGSVSQHLLHHAPCPVLIVRATDHG